MKKDLESSIAIEISKKINQDKNSVWYEKIKMNGTNRNGKSIGINAFHKSLIPLIQVYISNDTIDCIEKYNKIIDELSEFINNSWEIVKDKWKECFYDSNYNIQKGIGVYPIHKILSSELDSNNKDLELTLIKFRKIICESDVKKENWFIGNNFSELNCKDGFKTIEEYILNKNFILKKIIN